jgi:putative membrane protein
MLEIIQKEPDMANEKNNLPGEKLHPAIDSTAMAVDRTVMAADRSLMAWVRTGLSLISFGFTIYKFLENSNKQLLAVSKIPVDISGPEVVGLFMVGMGVLSLIMGTIENVETIMRLRGRYEFTRTRYSLFMAAILTIFGIVIFLGIVFQVKGIR